MPNNSARTAAAALPASVGGSFGGAGLGSLVYPSDEVYTSAEDEPPLGMPVFEAVAAEPALRHFGGSYGVLERIRPDIALLGRFANRVEIASFYLCTAFEQAGVGDIAADFDCFSLPQRNKASWFVWMADTTFCRFQAVHRALRHSWTPPADVEPLFYSAFHSLCDLTPASSHHLKQLYITRRGAAIDSLVNQLELTERLLKETVALAWQSDEAVHDKVADDDAARLAATQSEILSNAGEVLGLREAAVRIGKSHQSLHKRIQAGTAIGVMHGRELVIPAFQFVADGRHWKVHPDLKQVLALFVRSGAGMWAALQFLTDRDPLLGAVPADRLKDGDVDAVVHAARSYLGIDEP